MISVFILTPHHAPPDHRERARLLASLAGGDGHVDAQIVEAVGRLPRGSAQGVVLVGDVSWIAPLVLLAEEKNRPVWVDCCEDLLTAVTGTPEATKQWIRILTRADGFSVRSEAEEDILLGQLGFVGRLNRHTIARPLTCVVSESEEAGASGRRFVEWGRCPVLAADKEAVGFGGKPRTSNGLCATFRKSF